MSLSTKLFHWDSKDKQFSADMSDLGITNFIRIYPDACDEGLKIDSHKTGRTAVFYVDRTYTNPREPGEITHWELKPTPESIRKMPGLTGVTMLIWND